MKRKVFGKARTQPCKKCTCEDEIKALMSKDEDEVVAYSQANPDKNNRSGLRGDFYSEYYVGSGSSDWGKDKWQQMPEGDEINLKKDSNSAHSGNNYAGFQTLQR